MNVRAVRLLWADRGVTPSRAGAQDEKEDLFDPLAMLRFALRNL